jgi:hypothetical protein
MLGDLAREESTRVVVTLWALWHARRKIIHEGQYQSPLSTHCFVDRFIADLGQLEGSRVAAPTVKPAGPRWIPPPSGLAKVNVDAAVSKNNNVAEIAAVARDTSDAFLDASAVAMRGATDPEALEALACREGLALATDLLLRRVRVASDCQNAIRSIYGHGRGAYGHIVMELKARATEFQEVQFVLEGRSSNGDAHGLARGSVSRDLGRHVWFQTPPEGVCMNYDII